MLKSKPVHALLLFEDIISEICALPEESASEREAGSAQLGGSAAAAPPSGWGVWLLSTPCAIASDTCRLIHRQTRAELPTEKADRNDHAASCDDCTTASH